MFDKEKDYWITWDDHEEIMRDTLVKGMAIGAGLIGLVWFLFWLSA